MADLSKITPIEDAISVVSALKAAYEGVLSEDYGDIPEKAKAEYDRLKRAEKVGCDLADYIDTLGAVAGVPDLRTWKLVLAKARELLAEIARAA